MNHPVGLFGAWQPVTSVKRPSVRFGENLGAVAQESGDSFQRRIQTPRVLLVEDNADLIEVIRDAVDMLGNIELTGIATNYDDAVRMFREQHPDIVLLDKNIIGSKTGVDIHHTLRDEDGFPEVRMIFTSSEDIPRRDRGESPQIDKSRITELSGKHPLVAEALT